MASPVHTPWARKPPLGLGINGGLLCDRLLMRLLLNEMSGATAYDISGNNCAVSLVGNPPWQGGLFGPSLHLDGSTQYGTIANLPAKLQTGSVSVCARVRFNATYDVSATGRVHVFNLADANSNNDVSLSFDANGKANFGIWTGAGGFQYAISTQAVWTAGIWYDLVGVFGANGTKLYVDGREDGSNANTTRGTTPYATTAFFAQHFSGHNPPNGDKRFPGWIDDFRVYNRQLSAAEAAFIHRNPYFDLQSAGPALLPFLRTGANAFALNAEPGSYSISGAVAGALAAHMINAASGSYLLSGLDAGLTRGASLNAEPGIYSITGADAALLAARVLLADAGQYLITGLDATLVYVPVGAFVLNAEPGSYSIAGLDASVVSGRMVNAASGSYAVTGFDTGLFADRVIVTESGTYLISGPDAGLLADRIMNVEPGAYLLTGVDAQLDFSGDGQPPVIADVIIRWRRRGRR